MAQVQPTSFSMPGATLAGERALLLPVAVLRRHRDRRVLEALGHRVQRGERWRDADRHALDRGQLVLQLGHQGQGIADVLVQLPVANDERGTHRAETLPSGHRRRHAGVSSRAGTSLARLRTVAPMVDELGRRMRGWPRLTRQPDLSTARFLRQVCDELRACGFRHATLEVGDADDLVTRARRADALVIDGDRAAIPLTCGDLDVGALVLEAPGLSDAPALVEALRDAAGLLDLAVQTLDGAAARRAHEISHDHLFANMRNGLAHCRAIFDGERCVDWVYLRVNEAFVRQTGLDQVTGRRVTDAIPGIREADPELFALYGSVARGGETVRFERHVAALDEWFEVAAYRAGPDEFVAVFDVVTERKRAEAGCTPASIASGRCSSRRPWGSR
jgi:PAS domain-containing protein